MNNQTDIFSLTCLLALQNKGFTQGKSTILTILVFQNNETAALLVSQTNPVGVWLNLFVM